MNFKRIIVGDEARAELLAGVRILADAVSATLGPKGSNVVIEKVPGAVYHSTKDGVSVAREIHLLDPFKNMGAHMVLEAATKTADEAGDGTTTATILAHSILEHAFERAKNGESRVAIKKEIEAEVPKVVASLKSFAREVRGPEDIERVATISSNGDKEVGKLVSQAFEAVGKNGVVTCVSACGPASSLEITDGAVYNTGSLSPFFVTDKEKMACVLENPHVFLYEGTIRDEKVILHVMETALKKGSRPLLVICDGVEGNALATMVKNSVSGALPSCAVKSPMTGVHRIDLMSDLAAMTGATYIRSAAGLKLENLRDAHLGTVQKAVIYQDSMELVGFLGDYDHLVEKLQKDLELTKADYTRDVYQDRLAKLQGKVGVLYVGGKTDGEIKEKIDRVDDALCATRAALAEGVLPGGGLALFGAVYLGCGSSSIKKACGDPRLRLMHSAGRASFVGDVDPAISRGFDASAEIFCDLFEAGIIDPLKVVRCALENAASVACLMLMTETLIAQEPDRPKEDPLVFHPTR